MWELLQRLEELGWKPYGKSIAELTETEKNIRLLTSRSSGLWQFVCENGMVNCDNKNEINSANQKVWHITDYQYRIIESALCNEDELDKFLLENIKIS